MELLRRIRSALRDVTDQKQREITRNRLVRALIAYRRRCMGTEHWLPSGWSARDVESFEERELLTGSRNMESFGLRFNISTAVAQSSRSSKN